MPHIRILGLGDPLPSHYNSRVPQIAVRRIAPDMRRKTASVTPLFVSFVVIFFVIMAAAPRTAFAHAVLVSSQPTENGTVSGSALSVLLKYNSRVDTQHSSLTMLAPDGKIENIRILGQSAPNLLSANLIGLVKGAYVLRWQVLAGDGHITRGEIPFTVK